MGFPVQFDKAAPADADNPSAGAAEIRSVKSFFEDLFGILDTQYYSAKAMDIGLAGQITVAQQRLLFQNGSATVPAFGFAGATGMGLAYDGSTTAMAILRDGQRVGYLGIPTSPALGGTGDDTSATDGVPNVESGIWTFGKHVDLKTEAAATGMRIETGDGSSAGVLVRPSDSDDTYGQLAVAPKGTVTTAPGTSAAIAGVRVFADDPADYADPSDHQAVCLETHLDADGSTRYRIVTRAAGTGMVHRPFYFQVGGHNALYIHTNGAIVTSDAGPDDFGWIVASTAQGDLVIGVNGRGVRGVNAAGDDTLACFEVDGSDNVRIDSEGHGITAGTGAKVVTDSAGNITAPAAKAGTYVDGTTAPSVAGVTYLEIANTSGTTITNFTGGRTGQLITLKFADTNTTISRDNALLSGGTNFTSTADAILVLVLGSDGNWREVSRTTNNS